MALTDETAARVERARAWLLETNYLSESAPEDLAAFAASEVRRALEELEAQFTQGAFQGTWNPHEILNVLRRARAEEVGRE